MPQVSETDCIHVASGQVVDRNDNTWSVQLQMAKSDYCADIECHFTPVSAGAKEADEDEDAYLSDDPQVLERLNKMLADRGYRGPKLSRAESGMQADRLVVLEPDREFQQFAIDELGWIPADGIEEWTHAGWRREFSKSMEAACEMLILPEPTGCYWQVPMYGVMMGVEYAVDQQAKLDPAAPSNVYLDPAKRGNLKWLRDFLVANADAAWAGMRAFAIRREPRLSTHPGLAALKEGHADLTPRPRAQGAVNG